jgi:hypothetical protein
MQKRAMRYVCLLILVVLATGTSMRAQNDDQGKPPTYTYIAEWSVPRAQWTDMVKVDYQERPLMDKLVADGTLLGYGTFANLIHQEGEPTHGSWFTATSEGRLMKALEAVYAQGTTTSPVQAASKHWDFILVSRAHNGRSGHYEGAYLSGSNWDVKPGEGRAFRDLMNSRLVPVLEKLLADGALVSYSVDTEDYHTQKPGRVSLVFTTVDTAGLDKVDQTLEAAFDKDNEIGPAIRTMTDSEGHRDFLLRVTHMAIK